MSKNFVCFYIATHIIKMDNSSMTCSTYKNKYIIRIHKYDIESIEYNLSIEICWKIYSNIR